MTLAQYRQAVADLVPFFLNDLATRFVRSCWRSEIPVTLCADFLKTHKDHYRL